MDLPFAVKTPRAALSCVPNLDAHLVIYLHAYSLADFMRSWEEPPR